MGSYGASKPENSVPAPINLQLPVRVQDIVPVKKSVDIFAVPGPICPAKETERPWPLKPIYLKFEAGTTIPGYKVPALVPLEDNIVKNA